MEIKLKNISVKYKNKYLIKDLNLQFSNENINGILIKNDVIKQIFIDNNIENGKIEYNKSKKIEYIGNYNFLTETVNDEFFLMKNNIEDKENYVDKILSVLDMVNLDEDYLKRKIYSLSKSEKQLLNLSLSLIKNPDIIIFDNIFHNLDRTSKIKVKKLILELKKKYNKLVIVIDNNINTLYEICDYFTIFNDNNLVISDIKNIVFSDLDLLIENKIELPFLIKFSSIANDYNKSISYNNEINDLIKEVYKKC